MAFTKQDIQRAKLRALDTGKNISPREAINKPLGTTLANTYEKRTRGFLAYKKGSVMLYLSFIFIALIIILIASVFAPMGVLINTELYSAGESIMLQANASTSSISDATIRADVQDVINTGLSNQVNNIAVNTALFQYSWIFVLGLTALVIFIQTRRMVEYGGGGLV